MSRLTTLVLVAMATLAAVACSSVVSGHQIAPPLISPPATAPFTPLAVLPVERTAYVAIHFHDHATSQLSSHDSEAAFQGIRTMMHTIRDPKRGNSQRDRVVLVPRETPESERRTFKEDGLIVIEMDDALPHADICAPKFDRIYLWSAGLAAHYDRVIYLDWDVLVQRPMDHLFLCGEFCMVYNSILHFVDGLMVVKPDPAVFDAMVERYKRERLTQWTRGGNPHMKTTSDASDDSPLSLVGRVWSPLGKTECWERSYLFFLEWFGNMEAAPLFKAAYGQSPLKLQRLDASAQLNAMMWYEKYSWTLMRGKDYRNMSDPQEVPALSLGFTTLKPFHWGPGLFFNLGWMWSEIRDDYLGVSHTYFVVTRLLLWLAFLAISTRGLQSAMLAVYRVPSSGRGSLLAKALSYVRSFHARVFGPTDGYAVPQDGGMVDELVYVAPTMWSLTGYWLPAYGSDVLGVVFGSLQFFGLAYLLTAYTALIPMLTGPHPAWRLWLMFHTLGIYACNHWTFLAYHAAPPLVSVQTMQEMRAEASASSAPGPQKRYLQSTPSSVSLGSASYPLIASTAWLAGWELTLYVFMRRETIYPEFVVKMFVMFPLLAAMLIAAVNMSRAVWRSIEKAKRRDNMIKDAMANPGGGATSGVQMQSILPTSSSRS